MMPAQKTEIMEIRLEESKGRILNLVCNENMNIVKGGIKIESVRLGEKARWGGACICVYVYVCMCVCVCVFLCVCLCV